MTTSSVSFSDFGKRLSSSGDYQVPAHPTPKLYTDPQPWMVQEERSQQAQSLEVVHKSFHTVNGQSSGRLYFPMSGEESSGMFTLQSFVLSALSAPAQASTAKQGAGAGPFPLQLQSLFQTRHFSDLSYRSFSISSIPLLVPPTISSLPPKDQQCSMREMGTRYALTIFFTSWCIG